VARAPPRQPLAVLTRRHSAEAVTLDDLINKTITWRARERLFPAAAARDAFASGFFWSHRTICLSSSRTKDCEI
jgi:hypothetical protein